MIDAQGESARVGPGQQREAVLGVAARDDVGGQAARDLGRGRRAREVGGVLAAEHEAHAVHDARRRAVGARLVHREPRDAHVLRHRVVVLARGVLRGRSRGGQGAGAEEEGGEGGGGETHLVCWGFLKIWTGGFDVDVERVEGRDEQTVDVICLSG